MVACADLLQQEGPYLGRVQLYVGLGGVTVARGAVGILVQLAGLALGLSVTFLYGEKVATEC